MIRDIYIQQTKQRSLITFEQQVNYKNLGSYFQKPSQGLQNQQIHFLAALRAIVKLVFQRILYIIFYLKKQNYLDMFPLNFSRKKYQQLFHQQQEIIHLFRFNYLTCYLFIIQMKDQMRGKVCLKLFLLIQLAILSAYCSGYSCTYAMNANWLTSYAWGRCYQASDGTIIGYSQGGLSGGDWTGTGSYANWDYDYNNRITFIQSSIAVTQRWNYRYHSFDTCQDNYDGSGSVCGCGSGYTCYSSWWTDCCGYGCSCWPLNFAREWNYWNDDAITTTLFLPCHPYCSTCTSSWTHTSCQSCWNANGAAYQWLAWGTPSTYIDTCHSFCPNDAQNGYNNAYPGTYIISSSPYNPYCGQCNTTCSVCADNQRGQVCSVCVSNAALLQNYALCTQTFPNDLYCQNDSQCVNSCPTNLYFWLPRNQTGNGSYPFTANGAWNLQLTNVCYLCHRYCLTCSDQYDYKCTSCAQSYYYWYQYANRCNYYCNEGVYTSGGTRGEYVIAKDNRTCGICDVGCKFCVNTSSQCYICQDSHFLVDNNDTCKKTFKCQQCINSTVVTDTEGCAPSNNTCRQTNCPAFFYFRVNRTSSGNVQDGPTNPIYQYFTQAQGQVLDTSLNGYELGTNRASNSSYTSPQGSNPSYYYRQMTNLCVLCDYRCMQCFGPTNLNCTLCTNHYYKWTNATVCSSLCPEGQYQLNINASYPDNETMCGNCDPHCIACVGYNNNCTKCVSFPITYYGFLFTYFLQNSTCMTSCPSSPKPLTTKGYYGSIATMVCYPCPGQCSDCNIKLVMNITHFPELQLITCGGDYLCSKGIICTACLQGYSLAGGQCVDQTSCRLYSYYKKSANSSSAWSPTNCVCVDGYYSIGDLTCAPCDISCLTCNGSDYNNCLSCPVGYSLSANTCQAGNSGSQVYTNYYWDSTYGFNSYINTSYNAKFYCGKYQTLFGYKSVQSTNSTFSYSTNTLSGQNYYGISFRLKILFIDNWDTTAGIFFKLGSDTNPSFIYNYNNNGAIGEMQCGTNVNDYLITVAGQMTVIPTAANQSWTVYVSSNTNPVQNSSGFYYYWGIQNASFTVLSCHTDCASCTGPSATQCTSCFDSGKTVKNGKCICDFSRNYYYIVGSTSACQIGCNYCNSSINASVCYYRDNVTATCVNPPAVNCSAPYLYGDNYNIVNNYGTCVQSCGSGYYAIPSLMKCTTTCSNFGLFSYKGATGVGTAMWTCVKTCPSGLMLDLTTASCVISCPYYSSNTTRYFFQLQNRTTNPMCVVKCITGYEYDNENRCVMSCPSGYYTQTINTHNKCVQKCATDTYGDNTTLSCVAICPFPSIADPSTNLCVNECPLGYFFQINSKFGNRTCVTQCQDVQWLHPYFLNCSTNPMNCPYGTYADNTTHKCEFSCKGSDQVGQNTTRMCQTKCNTGYAYWDVGLCVAECNQTMFGYLDSTKRQCVTNCSANSPGYFADIQVNRTCVKNCSYKPYASFGQSINSTCTKLCPQGQFGDPLHPYRLCVSVCTKFPNQTFSFALTRLCVTTCPVGYYGDNYTLSGVGVCSTSCPKDYFGDPTINLCVVRCPYKYYGSHIDGRPCVTTCPDGYYAINLTSNRNCTPVCDQGYWADNYTRMCYNVKTLCSNYTFADAQKRLCVVGTNCTKNTYADPLTMGCESACTNSTYFGDPSSNLCVKLCPTSPDYYSQGGYCTATCSGTFFADYQANRTCLAKCTASPKSLYGTASYRCVEANLCGTGLFGNNNTRRCSSCSGSLPFGDPISFQCVYNCSLTYYGETHKNLCVLNCNFTILEYADNFTQQCTPLCTLGTFGVNSTVSPVCQKSCPPNSYALDTNRICMLDCGTGFFGDPITGKCYNSSFNCSSGYYGNTESNMCVLPEYCQNVTGLHYYADNATKMCISKCTSPNYGLNTTWYCVAKCPNPYYAENNTRICLFASDCGIFGSFADSQINVCVTRCSTGPVFTYSENITFTCVTPDKCPTAMLAENATQSCVYYCPHNSTYFSFADPYKSNRCVAKCPDEYYGDTSSGHGLCASVCPGLNYFRDNTTQLCVYVCPAANSSLGTSDTFGDNNTDMCVISCPPNYFAQVEVNRTCVTVCIDDTWGNQITRKCINNPVTSCPGGTWADNFTNMCTGSCSSNSSNNSQPFYGQNITKLCVTSCPVPSFAFIDTGVCIDICPITIANTPGFFGDPGTTPTRLCVKTCMTSGLYRDVAKNRTCQPTCTYNSTYKTYQNPTLMTCTAECPTFPQYLYAWASNSTNAVCIDSCPTGRMNDNNMSCVATCPFLLDPTTNRCVSVCPFNSANNIALYANLVTLLCVSADSCPNNTYASDDSLTCASQCPNNTYIYGKNCIKYCPNGYYINFASQTCVIPTGCPANYFANNQTTSCVSACSNGTFGDSTTRQCITACYGTNYADPLTGLCSSSCSNGLVKNSLTLSCVSSCAVGTFYNTLNSSCTATCQSPYYADEKSQACVLVCSSSPMTFASITPVRACVTSCPSSAQWFDLINRVCTATCPASSYQYSVNSSCVSFCPAPHYLLSSVCVLNCSNGTSAMYADSTTQTCVSSCPSGYFADPTTFKCVLSCPINPVRYYADSSTKKCLTACTSNKYADNEKGACVTQCSMAPLTYADPSSGKCVVTCPVSNSTFADPTTQKCVSRCPTGYFADNRQRMCLNNCSNIYYADSQTNPPACVSTCTLGYYADPLLFKCVTACSSSYFAYQPNSTCLQFCPYGYFANPSSKYCVTQCLISPNIYADNFTHTCTNACSNNQFKYKSATQTSGVCVYYCPNGFFADTKTMSCVTQCPSGYFGSTINNTCNLGCAKYQFKDSTNRLCQNACPSANLLFGEPYSRTCVLTCNSTGFSNMYADSTSRLCVATCNGSQYADPATLKCVSVSSCSTGTNADSHMKKCVGRCYNKTYAYNGICFSTCPSTSSLTLFADEQSQNCVTGGNCARGLFADPSKGKCVISCDIASNAFADSASGMCVTNCLYPLYADNITRTCASVCTSVPLYYGLNSSRICAQKCPQNSYGDPTLNLCVQKCVNGLYGDSSTWSCVQECPLGTFGNNLTNLCVTTCPNNPSYFGDMFTKTCVYNCSHNLYADAARNRECHPTCLSSTFSENSTMECVAFCLTGFADIRTGRCIANCTKGFYGFNFICYESQCPSTTPQRFSDDSTDLCVLQCPQGTFAQPNTRKCVKICPISYNEFADMTNRACTTSCPIGTYSDSSTRVCVSTCPMMPALFGINSICSQNCTAGSFADNSSRTCVQTCPNGTFADNSTWTCVSYCPSKPMYFADSLTNTCVYRCSQTFDYYADNSTRSCVLNCSKGTYADSVSRTCKPVCPSGYFGVNGTLRCERSCAAPSFADKLINLCVAKCSVDPIYYGDSGSHNCLQVCPTNSFGNPLTQQCVYNNGTNSTCPDQYYANPKNQLCTQVCPMKFDLYAEPITKMCKASCVSPYIADNSTMRCVLVCPSYPNYYANLQSGRCVKYCPVNTYADNSTRVCVRACPNGTYAQNSTWRCVTSCLNKPLTLRDSLNWKCVAVCPPAYFSDYINLLCVPSCTSDIDGFARNDTRQCVKTCPVNTYAFLPSRRCVASCYDNTYADNSTRTCVSVCPRNPALFADSVAMTCVPKCPPGMFAFEDTRECVFSCPVDGFYRENSSRLCVRSCNVTEKSYTDNLTGFCVVRCSLGTFADPTTRKCVSMCPDQPLMYAQNSTQNCVSICPKNLYGDNTTRTCITTCPNGSLSLPQNHLCVFVCPVGYYAYLTTQFCMQVCPFPLYGDPSTRTCVPECPINQLLYADNSSRTCVTKCPSGSYAYQWSVACMPSCPVAVPPFVQTYAASYDNTCVQQCAYPFYSYDVSFKCLTSCPNPYFNNLEKHKCQACPSTCSSCTGTTSCTSCFYGFFLQNGVCVSNCTLSYYANSITRTCVTSKSCSPNFGENSTHLCKSSCVIGSFANNAVYRCDACPSTCISCTSLKNCLTCVSASVLSNNFCYGYCDNTSTYISYYSYDDGGNYTCTGTCPDGTYASVVFCKKCDSSCSTCSISAKNCTNCSSGKYLYNGGCVSTCPTNFKPNVNRECISCNGTCGAGLTYNTNVTTVNGQASVFMNFNNAISFSGNLYSTFSVSSNGKRLLQSGSAGYQIIVIDPQTIQIVFPPGSTNTDLNVQIANPQNIVDSNGNLPTSLTTNIQLDGSNLYSTSLSQAPNDFPLYFTFLGIICLFSFVFDIELMKFLQIVYVHYFIAINLPPEFTKVFMGIKYSTLSYLPRLFSVEDAVLRPTVPSSIYNSVGDYNFLRNAGFAFTPLLVILIIWGLLKLLSVPEINHFKHVRVYCQHLFEEKFKFAVLLEWVGMFMLNTVFFAFLQLRDYNIYDDFTQASLILAHAFIVFFLIVCILVAYRVISFYQQFPLLSDNLKKAAEIILQDDEADNLVSTNIFLSQKKKIDLRDMYYPKINNENIFPFKCIYRYNIFSLLCLNVTILRAILLSAFIALPKTNPLLQMSLCLPLNVLTLLYFCKGRPYTFKFRHYRIKNYIAIYHEVCLIILELLMLALAIKSQNNSTPAEKQQFSYLIIYYLTFVCSVSFLYHLFALGVFIYRKVWLVFIESDLFKRNFAQKYAKYQAAKDKNKKLVKSIDPKAKEALKNMIKGYKKTKSVLRPSQNEKANSQLPVKYKLTYMDKTQTSSLNSGTTLSKSQRKKMLKEIFNPNDKFAEPEKEVQKYEVMNENSQANDFQYEEYEEEIEIKAKDLSKYVENATSLLRTNIPVEEL